jgi:hypothetical protein
VALRVAQLIDLAHPSLAGLLDVSDDVFAPLNNECRHIAVTAEAIGTDSRVCPESMSAQRQVSRTRRRERHRDPIHTVAKTSRLRPILEHVAEMSTAAMAMNLRPPHSK